MYIFYKFIFIFINVYLYFSLPLASQNSPGALPTHKHTQSNICVFTSRALVHNFLQETVRQQWQQSTGNPNSAEM